MDSDCFPHNFRRGPTVWDDDLERIVDQVICLDCGILATLHRGDAKKFVEYDPETMWSQELEDKAHRIDGVWIFT